MQRPLPLFLLLFFGSGCAALIYEVVWFQLLQLVLGSSAVSLGVLLGTYMGGMCLGSWLLPRLISPRWHPLAVYGVLELGIGIIGLIVPFAVPAIGQFYSTHAGAGWGGLLVRGVVAAICLLPPTLLMGATLPAIARWVESTPRGVAWMGFFYGGNIAGAVFGCLLAGFYLLRVHDMLTATFTAVGLNTLVGLAAFALAVFCPRNPNASGQAANPRPTAVPGTRLILVAIALSGCSALGAEVVWTRLLSLLLGGTVYTFSIILAVFLCGLGIGSSVGSLLARNSRRPQMLLGGCQLLLMGAIAWTAYALNKSLPYWPIDPSLSSNPWIGFQVDLMRCVWAVLPATLFWGASFPLALASVAAPGQDAGRLVGIVYAANTVGAIVGALAFSVGIIPAFGTQHGLQVLVAVAAVAAGLVFTAGRFPLARSRERLESNRVGTFPAAKLAATLACTAALAAGLVFVVPRLNAGLVAYGRYLVSREGEGEMLFVGEGVNSSVAVSRLYTTGARNFHVSGKIEASTEPQDMRLQRMLGHLPALLHPEPKSVLIVGCGAGVTAGSFIVHPTVKRIVICELEPLIPQVVARHFGPENHNLLNDPRVEVVYDDARHYILTTQEKFDIITSDPINPWVKGSATLYTREYFDLVKSHLNPGGVVTQWVPLYESTSEAVKSEVATFFQVFDNGTVWSNDEGGRGYDMVLLGQLVQGPIHIDALQERLLQPDHSGVKSSLEEVGFRSAQSLLETYAGQASELGPWLADAQINRDRNLRLQYLAGFGANRYDSERIFNEMTVFRRYPENLFVASDSTRNALRRVLIPRTP